ncbi:MAG: metallophosphoesterase [Geminicoccaceae bacterium]|nr:metallophosphoesterase [Geminicoccaceae bacterium]MDW8342166.1 metallophosphoesterase [Geminicoccaceae bacterium]
MVELFWLGAAGAAAVSAWAGLVEPRRLRVARYEVASPRWPARARPLRLAILGDLHAARPHLGERRLARVVARVIAERPDLVLMPGDFLANRTAFVRPLPSATIAAALAPLARAAPTLAVLGNHDWHRGAGHGLRAALEGAGIAVLENEVVELAFAGTTLQVAGLGCAISRRTDLLAVLERLDPARPAIVLSHVPDAVAYLPEEVLLVVAGHTHGGQVRLPGIGPLVTMSTLPRRFARGLHRIGKRHLLVTSGVGTSVLPIRLGVPPEFVVATVRAAAEPTGAGSAQARAAVGAEA